MKDNLGTIKVSKKNSQKAQWIRMIIRMVLVVALVNYLGDFNHFDFGYLILGYIVIHIVSGIIIR